MGVEDDIPIRTVLRLIGGKHKIAIVWMLSSRGPMRFSEIRKVLEGDATSRMLSISLRELEADGLISKKVLSESPPHTEYSLTTVGMSLIPILDDLCAWGAAYQDMVAVKSGLRSFGLFFRGLRDRLRLPDVLRQEHRDVVELVRRSGE